MRKFAYAVVATVTLVGFAVAADFGAAINKIETKKVAVDGKDTDVTFITYTKKAKKGEEAKMETMQVNAKVEVFSGTLEKDGKKNVVKQGDAISKGLTNEEVFSKIPEKGIQARIYTDDDNKSITKVVVIKKAAN